MKIKTESGVSISFIPEGSSKIILFDKPVRAIELKKEEISRINAFLSSSPGIKTNAEPESRHSDTTKTTKAISR